MMVRFLPLSKDMTETYKPMKRLDFNLSYYTEVQDLSYLAETLDSDPRNAKFKKLNHVICDLVEDFGLVGFETLAVEVRLGSAAVSKICGALADPSLLLIPPYPGQIINVETRQTSR